MKKKHVFSAIAHQNGAETSLSMAIRTHLFLDVVYNRLFESLLEEKPTIRTNSEEIDEQPDRLGGTALLPGLIS